MDHLILHQKLRIPNAAGLLTVGAISLLVIAALVRAAVPAVSDAGATLFAAGPALLWATISLSLPFFLP